MNRYSGSAWLRFPSGFPASTSSPSTSGGAGTRRARRVPPPRLPAVARRPRTTRCGCCGSFRATRSTRRPPIPSSWQLYDARDRRPRRRARRAATPGGRSTLSPNCAGQSIAYFSAEFALHQSLPIYAGGLGVLAGDHCKEASDLGVPLIGVGFMYPQGYFHQHVSADGWQEESYERLNWADAPIEPAHDARRQAVHHRGAARRSDRARAVWRVRLGRVKLYLLDTDLEENAPWDRELSARLYGGDRETRIQQEIILGIGGVRALKALGIRPGGVPPERRARRLRRAAAHPRSHRAGRRRSTRRSRRSGGRTVFTTHTPVPAGPRRVPVPAGRKAPGRLLGHARRQPRSSSSRSARTTTAAARSST